MTFFSMKHLQLYITEAFEINHVCRINRAGRNNSMNALTTNPPKIDSVFLDPIKLEGRRNNASIKESMVKLEGTTKKFKFQLQNQPWLDDPKLRLRNK